jgi:hypothetical protein
LSEKAFKKSLFHAWMQCPIISATHVKRLGGSAFRASVGKKLARHHLKPISQVEVVCACDPSYMGVIGVENHGLRPAWVKSTRSYLKHN